MAERIRSRGPGGAGGWLESACKLILAARAGVLLLTLISLTGEGERDLVAVLLVVAAAASFVPLRWWERVGPALVRHPAYLAAELMLAALILLLTPVGSPFFYFTLGTALLGGLLYGYRGRGRVLAAARRRVRVVARRARGRRPDPRHVPDLRRPAGAVPAGRGGGRRRAAAAGPPGRGGVRAGRGAGAGRRGGGAGAARARHARLARQDRLGHGLRRAGAVAPDRARPAGRRE